jgi:hypothetical protein
MFLNKTARASVDAGSKSKVPSCYKGRLNGEGGRTRSEPAIRVTGFDP